jgi:hypothetical protein
LQQFEFTRSFELFPVFPDDADFLSVESRELYRLSQERILVVLVVCGKSVLMNKHHAAVGGPTPISSMAAGKTLLQWQATGCHMALLFDANGRFLNITHQYANYAPAPAGCFSILLICLIILAAIGMLSIRVLSGPVAPSALVIIDR